MALERLGDKANERGVLQSPDLDPYRIYLTRFNGRGRAYFRIWIVNLLLSVLTLGIYSAWAKVRRERYFHRTLQLNGHSFDYHGQPLAILKGRLLVFGVLVALGALQKFSPLAHTVAIVCLLPVIPWLIVRAMRFRAANTSYCGIRFAFDGNYRQAATVFCGYGILTVLSFGLAFPIWQGKVRAYLLSHLRYGDSRFHCSISAWLLLRQTVLPMLLCVAITALLVTALGLAAGYFSPLLSELLRVRQPALAKVAEMAASVVGFVMLGTILPVVLSTRLSHLLWNHARSVDGYFVAELSALAYLRLLARNWLLSFLTLGLFIPFAKVAQARFRAERLALVFPGPLDRFTAVAQQAGAALADEAGDTMALDLAL